MKKLILFISFLSLIGCIEVQDSQRQKNQSPIVSKVSKITYEIEGLQGPQKYLIRFSGLESIAQITRIGKKLNEKSEVVTEQMDVVMEPGLYSYRIVENGIEKIVNIEIPQDFIVDGDYVIQDADLTEVQDSNPRQFKLNINGRLYFKSGSRLITLGRNLRIETEQMYSEGARILTWPKNSAAEKTNPGLSGGKVYIKSKSLVGSLQIEMRGQNGSPGETWRESGKRPENVLNQGTNGGNSGSLFVHIENMMEGFVTANFEVGKGGIGEPVRGVFAPYEVIKPSMGNGEDGIVEKSCLFVKNECQEIR